MQLQNFIDDELVIREDLLVEAEAVFDYLCRPDIVSRMIVASDTGLPAISFIAEELEKEFEGNVNFKLGDASNRQLIGRFISYILGMYGYTTDTNIDGGRVRLRNFCKAKYFKTAAIYTKSLVPKMTLKFESVEITK